MHQTHLTKCITNDTRMKTLLATRLEVFNFWHRVRYGRVSRKSACGAVLFNYILAKEAHPCLSAPLWSITFAIVSATQIVY
jgi:hypothetical protein